MFTKRISVDTSINAIKFLNKKSDVSYFTSVFILDQLKNRLTVMK